MIKIICKRCGETRLKETYKYCSHCAKKLSEEDFVREEESSTSSENVELSNTTDYLLS